MQLLFGIALLMIASAVVALFAIVAELVPRVPEAPPVVEPFEDVVIGQAPQTWPAGLPDNRRCVLLVLSTMCNVCAGIADQLVGELDWPDFGLVIAATSPESAEAFVAKHGLPRFPYYADPGGEWLEVQWGVRRSPLALVVRDGRLLAAYRFSDLMALRPRVIQDLQAA